MLLFWEATGYVAGASEPIAAKTSQHDFMVTTAADAGEGSLRQAILNANATAGADTIIFDSKIGPFGAPQTILLARPLPDMSGEVTIDGYVENRLWKPSGVTVSGNNKLRVFTVASDAKVTIRYLTVAKGRSETGGGIANRGDLVIESVTFNGNIATENGGGVANLGGTLAVVNSTFVDNHAGNTGGGVADTGGTTMVTNCTFSGNAAGKGGGLFSSGTLLVRNTILANSNGAADCVAAGVLVDPAGTNNLIEMNEGCGTPISTADPQLQKLGYYNGPSQTLPLGGASPAINMGANGLAVDEHGRSLRWDQRGNGDPRFVGGITDIGAFEFQTIPQLIVDSFEDSDLRACTRAAADCSLRGAITLANATQRADVITFDPKVFAVLRTIELARPLPDLATEMTIDASHTAGVTVNAKRGFAVFNFAADAKKVELINIIEK